MNRYFPLRIIRKINNIIYYIIMNIIYIKDQYAGIKPKYPKPQHNIHIIYSIIYIIFKK